MRRLLSFTLALVSLAGCSGSSQTESGSPPRTDAGVEAEAGTWPDAGGEADATDDADAAIDASDADVFDADVSDAEADAGYPDPDPLYRPRREACEFKKGALVADTIGITEAERAAIPIKHVIVFMQENRSFDHYLGRLTQYGHAVDGFPSGFENPTGSGTSTVTHSPTTCISPDIAHNWTAMHNQYDKGALDGFYINAALSGNGRRALYWFDQRDIPFYYWVYSHFAMSDRHFSSVMGPTWPNRDYLYDATSDGVKNTDERIITVPTIFDALKNAGIGYREYYSGHVRTACVGRTDTSPGVVALDQLFTDLSAGTLKKVSFVDVGGNLDEHSVADVQQGEAFFRKLVLALFKSPEWDSTALFYTYDEAGGFFDHVKPPKACVPDGRTANADFNRMGFRVPLLVVSPWARPGYVSHRVSEATSITRFIELLFDLPALTNRDANSDALLDLFDFTQPALLKPPGGAPAAGTGGCP